MSQEYEQSEELSTLKEETYQIIANLQKSLKEQVKKQSILDIALQEQQLRYTYIEVIRLITRGFVITSNKTTNTNTVIALMYIYHERLLKHTNMDQ